VPATECVSSTLQLPSPSQTNLTVHRTASRHVRAKRWKSLNLQVDLVAEFSECLVPILMARGPGLHRNELSSNIVVLDLTLLEFCYVSKTSPLWNFSPPQASSFPGITLST
jgi:hypothetical protein